MVETTVDIVEEKTGKKYKMSKPKIEILIQDQELEEIMVNAPGEPVFVYHRKHGMCETNLKMDENKILKFVGEVASQSNDYINESKPFLNARMPDGSRLNATIPPATPHGPTVTIRKFKENPLSIVDLIDNGTLNAEIAAFVWMAVEGVRNYPLNILILGGSGSGKTTLLNVLSGFMPQDERVITIEDTLELNFHGRDNVVRMESTHGSDIRKAVTMNDLLINALRMRPDRLIIGEVRGAEAETLFNSMNIGHSAMGTLHANSPTEAVSRLTNPPMNVAKNMLPLIDLIILIQKIRSTQGLKRRIVSIAEIEKSEVGVSFSEIFSYDPKTDSMKRTDVPSTKEEKLAKLSGMTLGSLRKKTYEKKLLIDSWKEKGKRNFKDIIEEVREYYSVM
jgi:flagellar protein FlaI